MMNKTRFKIIQSAVNIFNEVGLMQATNQEVAHATGISLSNFNYHFKTKTDLVIAVCDYMTDVLEEKVYGNNLFLEQKPGLHILKDYLEFNNDFRFFFLDTPNILLKFPELRVNFDKQVHRALQIIKNLNYMYVGMRIMKPEPEDMPGLYDNLAEQIWMNNHFFLANNVIRNQTDNFIENGIRACFLLTYPYLTEKGIESYKAFLNEAFKK